MTCWKDIAKYLGKGVRTVQRWEQELDLPVRRPPKRESGIVVADSDELDAWVHSQCKSGGRSELDALRKKVTELELENELLRAELKRVESTSALAQSGETADDLDRWMDQVLRNRYSQVVQRNNTVRLNAVQIIEHARNMKELRRLQNRQHLDRLPSWSIH
jgi:hypothetical protein